MKSSDEQEPVAKEEGIYICADGCERRFYREGEEFLTCAIHGDRRAWLKVVEQ